ncbi:MAG: hypothetical protein DSY76_08060 [Bacteroidetes bacterium]|nr:MAG: hypothetical protein DSY76_08060 [Bacteroidota bacterium]
MLRKILKFISISAIILMVLVVTLYIVKPQLLYKGFTSFTHLVLRTKPYPTKNGVHPFLQKKVDLVIKDARAKGIDLRVVQGFRSMETQLKFYRQGRSSKGKIITNAPPGLSYHNYGWAVDVCEYKNGKPYWKSKRWNEIGEIGKSHGLVWGGDWKRLVDKPHLQLSISDIITHCLF